MVVKKLLRFYFGADSLNSALDNIIARIAVQAGYDIYKGCEYYAEKIAAAVEVKGELNKLWIRLNGVVAGLDGKDIQTLKWYSSMRTGIKKLSESGKREIHRAVVKFTRRAQFIITGSGRAYKLLCAYYALISPAF